MTREEDWLTYWIQGLRHKTKKISKMVLHSAQYKRQSNDDAVYDNDFDTNIHTEGNNHTSNGGGGRLQPSYILNSNSMSLGGSSLSSEVW